MEGPGKSGHGKSGFYCIFILTEVDIITKSKPNNLTESKCNSAIANLEIYRSVVGARLGHYWVKNSNNLRQGWGTGHGWGKGHGWGMAPLIVIRII